MWIPFAPVAKGRPRFANGHAFTPKKTRDAEAFIRDFVFYHHSIPEPIEGPLAVSIRFFFKAKKTNYHVSKPDLMMLGGAVVDALGPLKYTYLGERTLGGGLLYNNNAQIVSLLIDKFDHPKQGIWIRWKTMPYPFLAQHPLEKK
jgi:Holliday junction resolvase RusA-like endonuclease